MDKLTNTEGWFVRINYWDGDTLDQTKRNEGIARLAAQHGSLTLKADIYVCHGATVVATYRRGEEVS